MSIFTIISIMYQVVAWAYFVNGESLTAFALFCVALLLAVGGMIDRMRKDRG